MSNLDNFSPCGAEDGREADRETLQQIRNMQAVRAFNRIWGPISDRLEGVAEADAGFDGGEFSGKFHGELLEREFWRVMDLVAARFGLTGAQLYAAIEVASQENLYRTLEARHDL